MRQTRSYRAVLVAAALGAALLCGCGREEISDGKPSTAYPAKQALEPQSSASSVTSSTPAPSNWAPDVPAYKGNTPPKVIAVQLKNPHIHRGIDIEVFPEGIDPDGDVVTYRYNWFVNGEKMTSIGGPLFPGDRFYKGERIGLRVVPFDGKDEGVGFTSYEFTVPNAPPRFISVPPLKFKAQVYVYDARAEDPDGDLVTYSLEAAPGGMTIDSRTGRVDWTIGKDQSGEQRIKIAAQDEEGMRSFQEYTLTIAINE